MKKLILLIQFLFIVAFGYSQDAVIRPYVNAGLLNGQLSTYYIDTSSTAQTKSGGLTLSDSLIISRLASANTLVLSPTATGNTDTLETSDGTTITWSSLDVNDLTANTTAALGVTTITGNVGATTYGSDASVLDAELLYINTLSSNAQTQINTKAPLANPTFTGLVKRSVTAGITAVNPGGQGDGALTSDINEISVCGTASDAVTLPTAVAGLEIFIINNGANTLEIWPTSGDNLGAGVDTATTLAAGANITFVSYDSVNWETK